MTNAALPSTNIPEGYMEDTMGRMVPLSRVREIDRERDSLVKEIVQEAKLIAGTIAGFKTTVLSEIQAFCQLSAEQYGVSIGGDKGNVTLMSYDGRYRIQRTVDDHLAFDERLQAAKALIDECVTDWAQSSRPELKTLINDTFQVDKSGRINTRRILSLRKIDIDDDRWRKAMQAIGDSLNVVGSKAYVRIYEKQGDGSYQQISLDLAAS